MAHPLTVDDFTFTRIDSHSDRKGSVTWFAIKIRGTNETVGQATRIDTEVTDWWVDVKGHTAHEGHWGASASDALIAALSSINVLIGASA